MPRAVKKQRETETESKSQELVNLTANYFEQYARTATQRPIVGRLLKFSKGDYLAGQEAEELPLGTKLIVVMDTFKAGWVKWYDGQPVDQRLVSIAQGEAPARRSDLGDTDQEDWEIDEATGKRRDPWAFANEVIMRPLKWGGDDSKLFTFVTQSQGGVNALGQVCRAYGEKIKVSPDVYPVIVLGSDSYEHSNKQYGRIKVHLFEVEKWVAKE